MISELELCTKCQTYLRAYNDRKQAEYDLVTKYDTKDTGEGKYWYLVDAVWVNKWKRYVRADHVTEIGEMSAPGPIANDRLLTKDNPPRPRNNLRIRIDYIGVNARVWWLFMHVHGGGPSICREDLDIYSMDGTPELDLSLDELRGKGAEDFSRRISQQFVDECHGDMEMYDRKYGSGQGRMQTINDARIGGVEPSPQGENIEGTEGASRSRGELEDRVRSGEREVEELRRKKAVQLSEDEKQLMTLKAELQRSQARQKELNDNSASEPFAYELQKSKVAQQRLEQKERELNAAQQKWDEAISSKEAELRRSRMQLQRADGDDSTDVN